MMVSNTGQSLVLSQVKISDTSTNVVPTRGKDSPLENNNADTVKISDASRAEMINEIKGGGFIDFTAEDGPYKKGLIFGLGTHTVNEWSAKGLEISDEAVIAAGKAFQEGLNKLTQEYGDALAGKGGISVNKHQVVINAQDVPDWFKQEYDQVLSSMENKEMKNKFEDGDIFFVSKPSSANINALASYASVSNIAKN